MLPNNHIWPIPLKPLPDELLTSWLVRLAKAHYLKLQTFSSILYRGFNFWNIDSDRGVPNDVLNILSKKTLTDKKNIEQTLLGSYSGYLFETLYRNSNTPWIMPLGIHHRSRKHFGLQCCTNCLENDEQEPYYRKKWRLSLSFVCPHCHIYLINKCPWCQKPISFHRIEMGKKHDMPTSPLSICFNCRKDLKLYKNKKASDDFVYVQKQLYGILDTGYHQKIDTYSHLYFSVLRVLSTLFTGASKRSHTLCTILMSEREYKSFPKSSFGIDILGVEDRAHILTKAYNLLYDWPHNFVSIMKKNAIYSSILFMGIPKESLPYWYTSTILEHLYYPFPFKSQ